jgi:hypothetical protein
MQQPEEQRLLAAREVGVILHLAARTVQDRGQMWLRIAGEAQDPNMPSSNRNGLRPIPAAARRHLYDIRDVAEYQENATRESIGAPLTSWRTGGFQ